MSKTLTGSEYVGSLLDEAIVIVYVSLFVVGTILRSSVTRYNAYIDKNQIYLALILVLSINYSIIVGMFVGVEGLEKYIFYMFYSFKKMFFLLLIIFPLFFLIKNAIKQGGEYVLERLVRFFVFMCWFMMLYLWVEIALRHYSPNYGSMYLYDYVGRYAFAPGDHVHNVEVYPVSILQHLLGIDIPRPYGFALDFYVSGHLLILSYMVVFFVRDNFKIFSLFNLCVFASMMVTGSRTYIIPFVAINIFFYVKLYGFRINRYLLVKIIGVAMLLAWFIYLMLPSIVNEGGYFNYLIAGISAVVDNMHLFIFGIGPAGMDFLGDAMVVHDYEVYDIHHTVSALVGLDVFGGRHLYGFLVCYVSCFSYKVIW